MSYNDSHSHLGLSILLLLILIIIIIIIIIIRKIFIRKLNDQKIKSQKIFNKDTIVFITGGCKGIGRAIIDRLIMVYKCKVINVDKNTENFREMQDLYNDKIINIYADLNSVAEFEYLLNNHKIDPIDISVCINNAAIANNKSVHDSSIHEMVNIFRTNLYAPIKITKNFLDFYNKNIYRNPNRQIHLCCICSVMSHIPSPNNAAYGSSKAGLFGFFESIRVDYCTDPNIHLTTICPYAINTSLFREFKGPFISDKNELAKAVLDNIILGKGCVYYPDFIKYFVFGPKWLPYCLQHWLVIFLNKLFCCEMYGFNKEKKD